MKGINLICLTLEFKETAPKGCAWHPWSNIIVYTYSHVANGVTYLSISQSCNGETSLV